MKNNVDSVPDVLTIFVPTKSELTSSTIMLWPFRSSTTPFESMIGPRAARLQSAISFTVAGCTLENVSVLNSPVMPSGSVNLTLLKLVLFPPHVSPQTNVKRCHPGVIYQLDV